MKAEKYRDAIIECRLGGKPGGARAQAEAVLEKHRKHLAALVLAAGTASTPGWAC